MPKKCKGYKGSCSNELKAFDGEYCKSCGGKETSDWARAMTEATTRKLDQPGNISVDRVLTDANTIIQFFEIRH